MPTPKPSNLVGFGSLTCVKTEKKLHNTHTIKQKQTNNSSRNTKRHPSKISKMPDSCGKSALPDTCLVPRRLSPEEKCARRGRREGDNGQDGRHIDLNQMSHRCSIV